MYGYLFGVILGLVLLGFLIAGLSRGRPSAPKPPLARGGQAPAADEPTPGRSAIATPEEAAEAQRHTPPA